MWLGEAVSARRNGDLAVGFGELAGAELLEGGQGPGGGRQGRLQGHRQIDLDLVHGGVLAAGHGLEIAPAGPADAASDVEEGDARNDEVTGVAPATVNDQVGQAIGAAQGLAVHGEAGLGLGRGGSGSALLEAGAFGTRGQAADLGMGHGGEAEKQEGGKKNGEKTAHGEGAG